MWQDIWAKLNNPHNPSKLGLAVEVIKICHRNYQGSGEWRINILKHEAWLSGRNQLNLTLVSCNNSTVNASCCLNLSEEGLDPRHHAVLGSTSSSLAPRFIKGILLQTKRYLVSAWHCDVMGHLNRALQACCENAQRQGCHCCALRCS